MLLRTLLLLLTTALASLCLQAASAVAFVLGGWASLTFACVCLLVTINGATYHRREIYLWLGASGKPGSLWSVGTLALLAASNGNAPPTDKAWCLKKNRFTLADGMNGGMGQSGEGVALLGTPRKTIDGDD